MEFYGTLTAINDAFERLFYKGIPNENGEDSIVITVNDTGASGSYGQTHVSRNTIDIWIHDRNDPAEITAPEAVLATVDFKTVIRGIHVTDVDVGDARLTVSLSANFGRLSLNSLKGISFSGTKDRGTGIRDTTMTFSGKIDDVNTACSDSNMTVRRWMVVVRATT